MCALTAAITGGATGGGTVGYERSSHTSNCMQVLTTAPLPFPTGTAGRSSHTSNYERSMCEQRCRIHCPPSGAADVTTWPAPVADNFGRPI